MEWRRIAVASLQNSITPPLPKNQKRPSLTWEGRERRALPNLPKPCQHSVGGLKLPGWPPDVSGFKFHAVSMQPPPCKPA